MRLYEGVGRGVRGFVTVRRVFDDGRRRAIITKPNQIMDTWGFIAAMTIGAGLPAYRVQAMYVEFENVASPGDAVTLPEFEASDLLDYYDDLALSSTRDYLRVPLLVAPTLSVADGYDTVFSAGEGNKLTFHAQSSGLVGVNGKTFSDSVNSTVYGAALVATPVFADRTKDVILSRSYLEAADQVDKLPSSQIGLTWDIVFAR